MSLLLGAGALVGANSLGWHFVQNGTSGIIALELIVVSPTLALIFDRVDNHDPLQLNGRSVWGALWNFETNKATPLELITDSFCGSGSILSNGTMVLIVDFIGFNLTYECSGQCWRISDTRPSGSGWSYWSKVV
ncbi:MAG TPA: hypothetical protein VGO47_00480 [Chlamydiales bacterium]|nr:hypothetical protein [Chlamydiales bacterium]